MATPQTPMEKAKQAIRRARREKALRRAMKRDVEVFHLSIIGLPSTTALQRKEVAATS